MGLCLSGSIAILWMGHPRSTFTLDRRPRLRTIKSPWGVDVLQPQVLVENLHVHQCLALFMSQSCVGSFAFLETPWGAYTRKLPWWKAVSKHGFDIRLDQCRYGTAYLKPTGLLCNSKQFKVLGKRCRRDHVHTPFNSSSSGRTYHYPEELCLEFAQLCNCLATAQSTSNPSKADFSARVDSPKHNDPVDDAGLFESEVETVDLRDHRGAQRFVSHLWSTQLAESLPWTVARRYKFARTNHINVLECHVRKTLLHLAPMDCRLVNFQDSMVTLGATAKGRSSSAALNSILRQDMSLQLAKNVYVCGIHCPTWALRADDPSRQRQVRPARAQLPQWLLLLKSGSLNNAQDLLDACSDTPRSWGRWLLFCQAAFLAASGQYDSIGDWTQNALRPKRQKGLGQRPSHRGYCANQENVVASIPDLDSGRRHGCSTNSSFGIHLVSILEEYGKVLYERGASRRTFAETVNCVVQHFPYLKSFMAGPWNLLTTWETIWPGKVHPPLPLPLMKALVCTAVAWGWIRISLLILIGFYTLLRPCELLALKVSDCLLTSETGCDDVIFLKLRLVKSRTRGARLQNVRLDVPFVVSFLKKCLRTLMPKEPIWNGSSALFRSRFQHLLVATTGNANLCVPSSLRLGGATFWFRTWQEDLPRLQWRGRWMHMKTLAHYIQEVGCINILEALSPCSRQKMFQLADLCESACEEVQVEADLTSQVWRLVQQFKRS